MNEIQAMADAGAEGAKAGRAGIQLVGKLFGPTFTLRQATADAQAEIQVALANRLADYIESNPLDPNVLEMLASCGGKASIVNLANALSKALPMLHEDADPSQVPEDWIANWRDKARLVSDEEMSLLWAQLLAGEVHSPGTYAPKTVNMLADMTRSDAQCFHDLCRFQVMQYSPNFGQRDSVPLVLSSRDEIYSSNGVTDEGLQKLASIGLIQHGGLPNIPNSVIAFAYSRGWLVNHSGKTLATGSTCLTYSGKQMSRLCLPLDSPMGFEQYLLDKWGRDLDIRHEATLTVRFTEGILQASPVDGTVSWTDIIRAV